MKEKTKEYQLNELLLRRKELAYAVVHRRRILEKEGLFMDNIKRMAVPHEKISVDQVTGTMPRLKKSQAEEELNFYSQKLREVDEAVQQANYTKEVEGAASIFVDFSSDADKMEEKAKGTITKKLAAFLTRRKTLNDLCRGGLGPHEHDLMERVNTRIEADKGIDEIRKNIEMITLSQAVAKGDFYYKQLRLVDEIIHKANHSTTVEAPASLMQDFV